MLKKKGVILASNETDDFTADLLRPLPLDIVGIHPEGGNAATRGMEDTLAHVKSDIFSAFVTEIHTGGKQLEFEAHAHPWMLPKDLFTQHPDWFRMNARGDRTPDYNLCVSNTDALAYLQERAAALAALLPADTGRYCYWTADEPGDCFCHCPDCRGLSLSDQYMIWCRTVLSGVRLTDPGASVPYLAYYGTMPPPKKVDPIPGIFLEYAPFLRDSYIPISNVECQENRRETRHLPDLLACFGTENAQVLEYWLDNSRFSHPGRPIRRFQFDEEILRRDLNYYLNLGFEWITTFACRAGRAYSAEYGEFPFASYAETLNSFQ